MFCKDRNLVKFTQAFFIGLFELRQFCGAVKSHDSSNQLNQVDWSKKVIQGSDNASRREAAWSVRGGRANGWRKFLFDQNGDQLMSGCLNLEALQALVRLARPARKIYRDQTNMTGPMLLQ